MSVVVDASALVALLIPEEKSAVVFEALLDSGAFVAPAHVLGEVANALLVNYRRGVIDRAYRDAALQRLTDFEIAVEGEIGRATINNVVALADEHGLTIYDALYLELALRRGRPLASLGGDLRRAALLRGVSVLPA